MNASDASERDRAFMTRALSIAEQGLFTTTPNPRVGCVVVRDGQVLGEGFHARAGGPHAEVLALADARAHGRDVVGATAYVTLEPCNHTGRTGPCTQALIDAGVARVVAAMRDPYSTASPGTERMRAVGIEVELGLLEREARFLNRGFVARIERGRPWVRLKAAASLDGRTALASGESRWITGAAARADGHRFRAQACAIMTGSGTVWADDPMLTVREVATPRQPLRIVIDGHSRTSPHARVFAGERTIVVTAGADRGSWPAPVEVLPMPGADGHVDLVALMHELGRREINEVHVEAGAGLNGALLAAGLVDEVVLYLAPALIGDPARGIAAFGTGLASLADRVELDVESVQRVGDDWRVFARILSKER